MIIKGTRQLSPHGNGDFWRGEWKGHRVDISSDLVKSIRAHETRLGLWVGPDSTQVGNWICTTSEKGWEAVPQVHVWYRFKDFVEYVNEVAEVTDEQ